MSLPLSGVWEIRTTGSDLNGGGFNPARSQSGVFGVDRSQQDAPHVTIDGSTITMTAMTSSGGIAQVQLAGHTCTSADLGNYVQISGGTMIAGVYEIIFVDSDSVWRLDRQPATTIGQTGTGRMGGAVATLTKAILSGEVLNTFWVRNGAGNAFEVSSSPGINNTGAGSGIIKGYGTTRGDNGRPTLRLTSPATRIFDRGDGTFWKILNIIFDGNSVSGGQGVVFGNNQHGSMIHNCDFINFVGTPVQMAGSVVSSCRFENCLSGIANMGRYYKCKFKSIRTAANSGVVSSPMAVVRCLFEDIYGEGVAIYWNSGSYVSAIVTDNTIVSRAGHTLSCGLYFYNNFVTEWRGAIYIANNIFSGMAKGIEAGVSGNVQGSVIEGNAFHNCAIATSIGISDVVVSGNIICTVDPFEDAAAGDFSLNRKPGGGAAVRGVANPLPGGVTISYADKGAVQSYLPLYEGSVIVKGEIIEDENHHCAMSLTPGAMTVKELGEI